MPLHLHAALQYRKEKEDVTHIPIVLKRPEIVGESEILHGCFQGLARAAACDVNVLITGETGTDKEVFLVMQ